MNSGVMRICRDRTSSVGRCRGDNMTRELKRANITLSETGLEQYRAPLVAYFLRRVHIRAEAEDLAQEVFARLVARRSEEHTSELQSLMGISYAVYCLNKQHN